MRKYLVAVLLLGTVFYFLLAKVDEPVDETTLIATTPQPGAGSGARPTDPPHKPVSILVNRPVIATPGGGDVDPTTTTAHKVATATDPDERTAALWQLADLNMAQFYAVLWQVIETEGRDDADFRELILATLEEQGSHTPAEILAALIQNAPTPALRQSALRLLIQASQELSIDPFNQALEDQDPAIRRAALDFYDDLSASALLDAVAGALIDRNQAVRLIAFTTLEEMYKFAPVWEIAYSVVDDPDPQIRMRALELLTYGDRSAAIGRLVLALSDPNPRVSELAGALLAELEQNPS